MNNEKNTVVKSAADRVRAVVDDVRENVVGTFTRTREDGIPRALLAALPEALRISKPVLHLLAAFMLAGTPITLGVRPFGLAFFSSCGSTLPFAYAGAVLRTVIGGRDDIWITLLSYTLLFALRILVGILSDENGVRRTLEDSIRIRMAVSVIGALAVGAYTAIVDSFSLASLGAFALYCTATPALTFLYHGIMSPGSDDVTSVYREAGAGAIAVSVVFSLRGIAPFSVDLSVLASFILTQLVTVKRGTVKGIVLGLFCGLSLPVALVPIYALSAFAAGVLCRASRYIAVSAAVMASLSWTVYAGGYASALTYSPELIISGIAVSTAYALGLVTLPASRRADDALPHEALLAAEKSRTAETDAQIEAEANAFSGMSDMLFRLSDKLRRPSLYDIREACDNAISSFCRHCRRRDGCWVEHDAEMSDAVSKIASTLHERGALGRGDVPDAFSMYCSQPDRVADRLTLGYARLLENLIDRDKTEVMAFDYSAMSAVLRDVITQRGGEYDVNSALSARMTSLLSENRIAARRVCVFGERKRTVYISDIRLSGLHVGGDDLRRLAMRACGGEFSPPTFELSGPYVNATLTSVPSMSVSYERAQSKKDESNQNGDVASGFSCRDDRWCAVLSDGMGSGREAALTSGICALFIEKMMSAGNTAAVTLKMLNCLLRAKRSECSATVDLFDLDLLSGKARFIKSGAAPSYVVRGSSVYKISSKTIPVGIVRTLDAEETTITLYEGDIVVLVSDGITRAEDDCAWLYSLLASCSSSPIRDTADAILRESARRHGRDDDATVCIMRVTPPSPAPMC